MSAKAPSSSRRRGTRGAARDLLNALSRSTDHRGSKGPIAQGNGSNPNPTLGARELYRLEGSQEQIIAAGVELIVNILRNPRVRSAISDIFVDFDNRSAEEPSTDVPRRHNPKD